ncbi:hypothetical protein BJI67_09565 [Acidihalobacter aeolianus]|uniref:Uncharacterized protein n=1 Tax=Acidihalobacter aeolianus TaxID=2792603 RepID=A0A1D8K8I0_9GAMM|nr:hypothetical protein BJI67_09565 [Acidihalobacter aeolianus]
MPNQRRATPSGGFFGRSPQAGRGRFSRLAVLPLTHVMWQTMPRAAPGGHEKRLRQHAIPSCAQTLASIEPPFGIRQPRKALRHPPRRGANRP